ncbi:thiol-disulfide isomerase/thioredoxin [Mumia flava]|uniref:Thiol-disulfide isomerase/thioredoxin n=1 Tax=Mumia flava TaxID=1348852 RepID=A0A2M9BJ79_9ACTN|nr:redoxin domain-containing protein [Mumia flava]PJJ58000.1 thiol-disulfide isomerase/thioredoxin [Mumia flava]
MHRLIPIAALTALALSACGTTTDDGSGPSATESTTTTAPATGTADTAATEAAPEDEPVQAPTVLRFEATSLDGEAVDGTTYAGTPVVFWFWAPWCPTCQGEGPAVAEAADALGDDAAIVGVAGLDRDADAMASFVDRTGTDAITHLDDRDGDLYRHFGVTTQSTYVVVSPDGTTVSESGPLSAEDIAALVDDAA